MSREGLNAEIDALIDLHERALQRERLAAEAVYRYQRSHVEALRALEEAERALRDKVDERDRKK